jgi:hypothetical protein
MTVPATIGYWKRAETGRTKSQKFSCSICGGPVYSAPAGSKKQAATVCDYPYCPYCLHEMRSSAEMEGKA